MTWLLNDRHRQTRTQRAHPMATWHHSSVDSVFFLLLFLLSPSPPLSRSRLLVPARRRIYFAPCAWKCVRNQKMFDVLFSLGGLIQGLLSSPCRLCAAPFALPCFRRHGFLAHSPPGMFLFRLFRISFHLVLNGYSSVIRMGVLFRDWCLSWYDEELSGAFEDARIEDLRRVARELPLRTESLSLHSLPRNRSEAPNTRDHP